MPAGRRESITRYSLIYNLSVGSGVSQILSTCLLFIANKGPDDMHEECEMSHMQLYICNTAWSSVPLSKYALVQNKGAQISLPLHYKPAGCMPEASH